MPNKRILKKRLKRGFCPFCLAKDGAAGFSDDYKSYNFINCFHCRTISSLSGKWITKKLSFDKFEERPNKDSSVQEVLEWIKKRGEKIEGSRDAFEVIKEIREKNEK